MKVRFETETTEAAELLIAALAKDAFESLTIA